MSDLEMAGRLLMMAERVRQRASTLTPHEVEKLLIAAAKRLTARAEASEPTA